VGSRLPSDKQPIDGRRIPITSARVAMAHLIHHWTTLAPLAAAALLVLTTAIGEQPWLFVGCVAAIIAAVLAAVHHAEVIAHRVGEPLGTLVLALAVTVIEAALLLSLLVAGGAGMPFRDFMAAAGGGNLAVAAVWTLAGAIGREADSLQWVLVASLAVPVAITWLAARRSMQSPSRQL